MSFDVCSNVVMHKVKNVTITNKGCKTFNYLITSKHELQLIFYLAFMKITIVSLFNKRESF